MDPKILGPMDTQLALVPAAVTKTATFSGTAIDMGVGFAPGANGLPVQCAIPVSAADFTSGDETYKWQLEESSDNSTFTACGEQYSMVAGDVGAGAGVIIQGTQKKEFLRYTLTIAGTTPTVTYGPAFARHRDIT